MNKRTTAYTREAPPVIQKEIFPEMTPR